MQAWAATRAQEHLGSTLASCPPCPMRRRSSEANTDGRAGTGVRRGRSHLSSSHNSSKHTTLGRAATNLLVQQALPLPVLSSAGSRWATRGHRLTAWAAAPQDLVQVGPTGCQAPARAPTYVAQGCVCLALEMQVEPMGRQAPSKQGWNTPPTGWTPPIAGSTPPRLPSTQGSPT